MNKPEKRRAQHSHTFIFIDRKDKMTTLDTFKNLFKGDIVEPSSPEYLSALARWAKNSERKARYVVFPKDEEDVANAIKFATSSNLPLAVKGGGHNPSGASSVDDGLCIDLSRYLNTTRIDPENRLAYVKGGSLWKTVDYAAIEHGLATPGGTVNHTGVAGLALGGGYGFLSGRHGLSIDNLVQANVVLADGTIVTASESSHPDLFWAIRGGGGNFGVVTEFVFKLHPQSRTVFAGLVVFSASLVDQIAVVVDQWFSNIQEDNAMTVGLTRTPDKQPAIVVCLFHNGSAEEGRRRFKPLLDLGPLVDMTREMPYEQVNEIVNEGTKHGRRVYMSGTSLRSSFSTVASKVLKPVLEFSEIHPTDASRPAFELHVSFEFFSYKKICQVPADATACRSRGEQPNAVILVIWDEEEEGGVDVQHARSFSRELIKIIQDLAVREPEENENSGYGNYTADPIELKLKSKQLWGNNYSRLQRIKHEYDRNSVFNRWIPIYPDPDA